MIIKMGEELPWRWFRSIRCVFSDIVGTTIKATRIEKEDFIFETPHGWVQGYKGQWLVELGERLRCNLDHYDFMKSYKPVTRGVIVERPK